MTTRRQRGLARLFAVNAQPTIQLPEPEHPDTRVRSGIGAVLINPRTADTARAAELAAETTPPPTPLDRNAESWSEWEQGWKDRAKADDAKREQEQRQREATAKKAQEQRDAKAQLEFNTALRNGVFERYGTSPEDRTRINQTLVAKGLFHSLDALEVALMELQYEREGQ